MSNLELVEEQLEALKASPLEAKEVARVEAGYLARQMDFAKALDVLEPWVGPETQEEDLHSLYLQISLASQDSALRRRGLDHILNLATRDDTIGLKALRMLIPLREKSPAIVALLESRLAEHPEVERMDRMRWLSWKLQQAEIDSEKAYQEVVSLFHLEDPAELIELTRWLNQNGFSARVLNLVSLEEAKSRQDLFLITMDALALQNR